jgi:hypothetical protein
VGGCYCQGPSGGGYATILDIEFDTQQSANPDAASESPPGPPGPEAERAVAIRLSLLGGFELTINGSPVEVALSARRLVAFLAMQERAVLRAYVAACLWIDKSDERAGANLRAALWRLRQPGVAIVDSSTNHLRLNPAVSVDVRLAIDGARKLLDHRSQVDGRRLLPAQDSPTLRCRSGAPPWWRRSSFWRNVMSRFSALHERPG